MSPKSIRVYEKYDPDPNNDEVKPVILLSNYNHNARQAKSVCFTETWMLIMGLTATETTIKGFLIESDFKSPDFDFGLP